MLSSIKLKKNGLLLKFITNFQHVPFYPKNVDYDGNPKDLCSLIRGLLVASLFAILEGIKYLLATLFIVALVGTLAYSLTLPFQYFINLMFFNGHYAVDIEELAFIAGGFEVVFLTGFFLDLLIKRFFKYLKNRKFKTTSVVTNKQPNIFIQYIKDKHNRVCRSIELED